MGGYCGVFAGAWEVRGTGRVRPKVRHVRLLGTSGGPLVDIYSGQAP